MKNRIFAIYSLYENVDVDNIKNAYAYLKDHDIADEVKIFSVADFDGLDYVKLDADIIKSGAKVFNKIISAYKSAGFTRFLHVISDAIVFKDGIAEYVNQLEKTMDITDYDVHFSTITDPCNYVYSKYNPRLELTIDDPKFILLGLPSSLCFTSHSNTEYMTFNLGKAKDEILSFNENFTIPMFYIIEYLARRKNTKSNGQLFYMNQYLSIKSEINAFSHKPNIIRKTDIDLLIMSEEDKIFKEMNVDFAPENSIDNVLENTYEKLLTKI